MQANNWNEVWSVVASCWLPSDYRSRVVRELSTTRKARVKVDSRRKLMTLAPVLKVLFLRPAPSWTDARQVAAAYFNRVVAVALPGSFSDVPVLAPDGTMLSPNSQDLLVLSRHLPNLYVTPSPNEVKFPL